MDINYYSDLSKKEDKLVLIAVYHDQAVHAVIEKEAFKNIKDLQLCVCQELIKGLV